MPLTIPELARAVGKSENYVRQHIFRKHLAVQKDGRNLSVTYEEAQRWARERQLIIRAARKRPSAVAGDGKPRRSDDVIGIASF